MKCERTYNSVIILAVIFNPLIWDAISEDGMRQEDFILDVNGSCWLELRSDAGELVGVYELKSVNCATLELHAHVMPELRKEHSRQTGIEVLKWIALNAPSSYQKLIAKVPDMHENVHKFLRSFKFTEQGKITESHWKGGKLHDVTIFGLARSQIQEAISG